MTGQDPRERAIVRPAIDEDKLRQLRIDPEAYFADPNRGRPPPPPVDWVGPHNEPDKFLIVFGTIMLIIGLIAGVAFAAGMVMLHKG